MMVCPISWPPHSPIRFLPLGVHQWQSALYKSYQHNGFETAHCRCHKLIHHRKHDAEHIVWNWAQSRHYLWHQRHPCGGALIQSEKLCGSFTITFMFIRDRVLWNCMCLKMLESHGGHPVCCMIYCHWIKILLPSSSDCHHSGKHPEMPQFPS